MAGGGSARGVLTFLFLPTPLFQQTRQGEGVRFGFHPTSLSECTFEQVYRGGLWYAGLDQGKSEIDVG